MMLPMLLGGGGGAPISPFPLTRLQDDAVFPAAGNATLNIFTDGTLGGSGSSTVVGTNWYLPTLAGIGAFYWVRLKVNSGSAPTSGAATNSWLPLTSAYFWTWSQSGIGFKLADITVDIATDAGGVNIVATAAGKTVSVEVA